MASSTGVASPDAGSAGAGTGGTVAGRAPALLEARGVSRRFGGVQALRDVDVAFAGGEVHALVGENGAGKSTLGKIVAGVQRQDRGTLLVEGREVHYRTPHHALQDGITIVAQELSLVPQLSVLDNVMLGNEISRGPGLDRKAMLARYRELDRRTGFGLAASRRVGELRVADQQKVEIMRCLARGARLIVMDEPTAALTGEDSRRMWEILRELRDSGTAVVLISHHLRDVLAISDRITVLRNGAKVAEGVAGDFTEHSLVAAMTGHAVDVTLPAKRRAAAGDGAGAAPPAPPALAVRGLRTRAIADVSFEVRRGEIVGLAGLVGAGRSEIGRAIAGADQLLAGTVEVDGRSVRIRSSGDAIRAGIALLPESRKEQGLVMRRSTRENIALPHLSSFTRGGVLRPAAERQATAEMLERVGVRADALEAPVVTLSGGNQQKSLFAKCLLQRPAVLIADEPTRGVDVAAKLAIYRMLTELSAEGLGIVVISSELDELRGLAHRLLVVREGRIQAELPGDAAEAEILHAAFGTDSQTAAPAGDPPRQGEADGS